MNLIFCQNIRFVKIELTQFFLSAEELCYLKFIHLKIVDFQMNKFRVNTTGRTHKISPKKLSSPTSNKEKINQKVIVPT